MTQLQEEHLSQLKKDFQYLVDAKYRKGAAEHGGDLQDMSTTWLVDEILNECIDLYVYVRTLKLKLARIRVDGSKP